MFLVLLFCIKHGPLALMSLYTDAVWAFVSVSGSGEEGEQTLLVNRKQEDACDATSDCRNQFSLKFAWSYFK